MPDVKIGVLVAQLGTPDAPTPEALRRYLRQFLSDKRVVDINPLIWQPILRLIVLRRRPARSARLYQRIWTKNGSPLLLYSQAQADGLQERLGNQFRVILGMRYGKPGIADAMQTFEDEGINRIIIFPMFPQFSSATTGSIYDAVIDAANGQRGNLLFDRKRRMPTLRFVPPYYDHPDYIESLKSSIEDDLRTAQKPDLIQFSFHGIPKRFVDEGDPYRQQCEATAQLTADALGLKDEEWRVSFQSQFGKEPWLQPYTEDTLRQLPRENIRNVAVTCPGFTADCLETLDEIGNEGKHQFEEGGGQHFHFIPCLNDHPVWLDAMAAIVQQESSGWVKIPTIAQALPA
ncbi:MAG: ferrochelatase [Anaerolineae bacterium]|nr:ferrochelatase [Anaerolineae bacterium]